MCKAKGDKLKSCNTWHQSNIYLFLYYCQSDITRRVHHQTPAQEKVLKLRQFKLGIRISELFATKLIIRT